ncbi:hypothetical protein WR25_11793 [Diploscapter pachys]|uniref:Uncharacterized protein n=1 Tax=Diploscapter pachys TaxID=2018661 RepID=A0A2A2J8S9_9BILA|nr:hypothetical protein WR25_11793 [Diploscapter pachys]
MLAPIVTKDMKLFPSTKIPPSVRNVRSRAQSLDHIQQLQNSGSTRGRIITSRPRVSQSTGNLPSVAKSPPKSSTVRKTTLTAIQEGVEYSESSSSNQHNNAGHKERLKVSLSQNSPSSSSTSKGIAIRKKAATLTNMRDSKSTEDMDVENSNLELEPSSSSPSPTSSSGGKKGSIIKWFSSVLRKSSKENKDKDNISTNSS